LSFWVGHPAHAFGTSGVLKGVPKPADTWFVTTRLIAETHRGTETMPVRRGLAILVSAIVMLIPLQGQRAEAVSDDEVAFGVMMNRVRDNHGARTLRVTERLSELARRHSRKMATQNQLFHSDLRRTFRGFNYRMVGENVGYAGSLDQLLDAFMDSPPHRENLVARWRKTGVGVYWQGDRVWVTQVFLS
jgi:uncharacterized protein YkwD